MARWEKKETGEEERRQKEARATKTFTPLTALDSVQRCSYLFPSGLQCFRNGEFQVSDIVWGTRLYQLCHQHTNIAMALDSGQMTSSGDQTRDQRLPPDMNDDGKDNEASKDVRKRNYTGAFNTQEIQPGS